MPERFICSGIGALFYVGGKPKSGLAETLAAAYNLLAINLL